MHNFKGFIILCGIILDGFLIHGLQIHFPPSKVGNYGEITEMSCTDVAFNIVNGYSWSKDNSFIYDSVTGDATGTGKYTSSHGTDFFTLEITNTSLDDVGDYTCSYNFNDETDTLSIQRKATANAKLECADTTELQISLTNFYPNSVAVSSIKCNGKTINGSSTTTADGDFFNMVWKAADVYAMELKDGCDIEISSLLAYNTRVDIDLAYWLFLVAVLSLVVCLLGIAIDVAVVIMYYKEWFQNKILLAPAVLDVVLLVTSIGLGAAVLAHDDIECFEASIKGIAIASTVIGPVGTVVGISKIIFLTKEGGPDGGHNGGGAPMTHARVHAGHEETHRGSLSNRPMPAINTHQGQDKKGRGLSANFDDDHPMISISVPEKKAGDLGPLQEEPQKKRKKKKKRTDEE